MLRGAREGELVRGAEVPFADAREHDDVEDEVADFVLDPAFGLHDDAVWVFVAGVGPVIFNG